MQAANLALLFTLFACDCDVAPWQLALWHRAYAVAQRRHRRKDGEAFLRYTTLAQGWHRASRKHNVQAGRDTDAIQRRCSRLC